MKKRAFAVVLAAGFLSPVTSQAQLSKSDAQSSSRLTADRTERVRMRKNAAIHLLRREITDPIEWDDVTFEFVLDWLREQGDANVVVNWNALEVVGIQREALVTGLALRDIKVADVLDEVLDQLFQQGGEEISYRGIGNTLRISTKQDFNRKLYLRFYDVTELLFRVPDSIDAPEIDLTQIQQAGGSSGGGGGSGTPIFTEGSGGTSQEDREVTDEELNQRLEEIRVLIEDSIEPDSWDAVGGRGTIRYFNRTLVVRNSVEVHEQIAGYFALGP